MLVVTAAFVRNEIASENYDEANENILQLLPPKNCSELAPRYGTMVILWSFKLNHVVEMPPDGTPRIEEHQSFVE